MAKTLKAAKNYDAAAIGSVMNYLTRELNVYKHAFDMRKLNKLGMLLPHGAELQQTVDAHAYSLASQESSSSSTSTKAGFKTPLTRAALEHHTSTGHSQLDTANGMFLTAGMAYRDYRLELTDVTEEKLYGCADEEFQKDLHKIASAVTEKDWRDAYRLFTKRWGHGFVSGLKLISAGICEFTTGYVAGASEQRRRHGTNISVGRENVGVSRAKDWAEEEGQRKSNGSMKGTTNALPAESPCATWASACSSSWSALGLSNIAQKAEFPPAPPATDVTAPDIPEVKPPKPKDLPAVQLTNTADMVRYMQLEQMNADGVDITKISPENHQAEWDAYQATIATSSAALHKNAVALDGASTSAHATADAPPEISGDASPDLHRGDAISDEAGVADPLNAIKYGVYTVYDVVVTPYKDVFESLNWDFHAAPSRTGLYLARIHMFIMTRQLIGSYFRFLASLPTTITGGSISRHEADAFELTLKEYSDWVVTEFASNPRRITSDSSHRLIAGDFERRLSANGQFANGMGVYHCFLENFRYLSGAPYGFLLTAKEDTSPYYYYANRNTWVISDFKLCSTYFLGTPYLSQWDSRTDAVSTGKLAEYSFRVFPIVSGKPKLGISLAMYVPSDNDLYSWCTFDNKTGSLTPGAAPSTWELFEDTAPDGHPDGKWRARSASEPKKVLSIDKAGGLGLETYPLGAVAQRIAVTLTPIDFADVEGGTILGIPMWYEQPYDLVQESVLKGF